MSKHNTTESVKPEPFLPWAVEFVLSWSLFGALVLGGFLYFCWQNGWWA